MRYPRWARLDYGGVLVGLVVAALSMTPSMLPRPVYYQGIVAGLSFGVGYALGAALWWVVRRTVRWRSAWLTRWGWVVIGSVWAVAFGILLSYATRWQNGVRTTVGLPPLTGYEGWLLLVITAATAAVTIAIGRGVRRLHRALIRRAHAHLHPELGRNRRACSVALATAALAGIGFIVLVAVTAASVLFLDFRWQQRNDSMDPNVAAPTSPLRSGGPGSLVTWKDIGLKGRAVIASGPNAAQIEAVTGKPAIDPIRIYVGLESAPTYAERAELAVAELTRVHAEDRAVVVIPGLTGTGWLEAQAIDSLEYLHGGDTAMVAAQYSISPSWVSSIFHPDQSRDGTKALYDAVHAWWAALPPDHRPQLVVYGLSLGSEALQSVFSSPQGLLDGVQGAVFAGTPSGTPLDEQLRAERDVGTPVTAPVVSAYPQIRYFSDSVGVASEDGTWPTPRIVYLEHGNDPVVWVNWSIFYRKPEWLAAGQRSPSISSDMHYIPIVTGLQSIADMAMAEAVPDDAGHKYGDATFVAWVQITGDGGLDDAALARIRAKIATYDVQAPISQ